QAAGKSGVRPALVAEEAGGSLGAGWPCLAARACPRRRGRPLPLRIPGRVPLPVKAVRARLVPDLRGFAARPLLERRAHRERARQAVGVLVGLCPGGRANLRVTAVPLI